jgi:septum formation protein
VPFTVRPTDVEELSQGDPGEVALENALRKARAAGGQGTAISGARTNAQVEVEPRVEAGAGEGGETILGVDTLVALDDVIYGKPVDAAHARATLRALSGSTHNVLSGLVLLRGGEEHTAVVSTAVSFRELDEPLLDWYLATGEWEGRAGGYAIQGAGALLVRSVHGDYENVVGLPLASLLDLYPQLLDGVARSAQAG